MTRTPQHRTALSAFLAVILCATVALAAAPLVAHEFRGGNLDLLHPSVPPTPPGANVAAGYVVIVNSGTEDERLLGGSAPFADGVELHRTTVENDVARMRRLDDGLAIPAGATVRLEPGGMHLMFVGLAEPLHDGERRPVTLVFERAGDVELEFAVERPGPGGEPAETTDHGGMDHGAAHHDREGATSDEAMKDEAGRQGGETLDVK